MFMAPHYLFRTAEAVHSKAAIDLVRKSVECSLQTDRRELLNALKRQARRRVAAATDLVIITNVNIVDIRRQPDANLRRPTYQPATISLLAVVQAAPIEVHARRVFQRV